MKKILVILGGMYHDFEGFAHALKDHFSPADYQLVPTYDLDHLLGLQAGQVDVVLSYTSLSKHRPGHNDSGPEKLSNAQVSALQAWVQAGGGLLAVHCGTVVGDSSLDLARLLGGQFIEHPPQFAYTVYPLSVEHPMIAEVEAFSVHDEFYIQRVDPSVQVHLVSIDRGLAYPMAWSKSEGRGRVAHLAPGHAAETWYHPMYRRLLIQAVEWVSFQR
jgi:type 1 glutamine amidotransferase